MTHNGHAVSFYGGKTFENSIVVVLAQLCDYIKTIELHTLKG